MYAADFASVFGGSRQMLISHLIGVAGVSISTTALGNILANRGLTPQAATEVLDRLQKLDTRFPALDDAIRGEGRCMITTVRRASKDPSFLALSQNPKTAQMLAGLDQPSFERDADNLYSALSANYAKPFWEHQKIDPASLVKDPKSLLLLQEAQPNFDEADVRAQVASAKVRLCILIAARRAGKSVNVVDPFDGQPMRTGPGIVYSVGPDRSDQKGRVIFDAKNGTTSAGDVVLAMP